MGRLFSQARSKIERAKEHIDELNRIFTGFTETRNYAIVIDYEVKTGRYFLRVRSTKSLPEQFSFVLGDAIHNLRAALDYAMSEMELLWTGKRTTFTKFPICETHDALIKAIKSGLAQDKAPRQVYECIEDVVQPYRRGDGEALWCLHLLDIRDKHELLIANTELTDIVGIRIKDERGKEHIIDPWRVVDHHIAQVQITGTQYPKITDEGQGTFRVTFNQWLPFGRDEIIPTLYHLAELLNWTLNEVERSFRLSHITLNSWVRR